MHPRPRTLITTTTTAAALAAGLALSAPTAGAAPDARAGERPKVVAKHLVTPLSLAVTADGTRWFSQNFAGMLMRQRPGGQPEPVFSVGGGKEVGAVSVRRGVVTFAVTGAGGEQGSTRSTLHRIGRAGRERVVADLGRHERRTNPDSTTSYGFESIDPACAAQLPAELGPATYTGRIDTHPYATASTGGTTYVADAAANAVLAVSPRGRVRTVAVLPPVPVVITAPVATANGLPACSVGRTYRFEAVPTDVEVGPGGSLVVSSLPGGPEDGSTGPLGSVWRLDPRTGQATRLAGGLLGATGVAVAPNGDIYATQLFGGQVSVLRAGTTAFAPFASAPLPGAVEWAGGRLWGTVAVLPGGRKDPPAGKLVRFR